MRIARIVAGAKFNRADIQFLELFENLLERELREQCGKASNFHQRKRITACAAPG